MLTIGLIGGVASGKSLVAEEFRRLGAVVFDADRAGHEVLTEPEVKAALRHRWGASVFTPSGEVDRAAVAKIVFAPPNASHGPNELAWLEQLTHPRITAKMQAEIARLTNEKKPPVLILDAPILLKAGWDRMCQQIVFVDASAELRLARARGRGWTAEQFAAREQAQEPLDYKMSRADLVIDNSGTPERTRQQVAKVWSQWTAKQS